MNRRSLMTGGLVTLVLAAAGEVAAAEDFPPVPKWRPSFAPSLDSIEERFSYYTDAKRDFVVLRNDTCVTTEDGLTDAAASAAALATLSEIFNYHPDMNPAHMDDGNVMVRYNHPAFNVVLSDLARVHWDEVEARHQDGLARDEVLFTPLGQNVFDDFGKMALLGRCYMFMDAQAPQVARIVRAA